MPSSLISGPGSPADPGGRGAPDGPLFGLRIEGRTVALVLQGAQLPQGAHVGELVIELPHVEFPFDFRDGVARFRHHRGVARALDLALEARLLLDWLHGASRGRLTGRAVDDALVLFGQVDPDAKGGGIRSRFSLRARLLPDPQPLLPGLSGAEDEPTLLLSLHDMRVYGVCSEPWPTLAGRVLDLLPADLVVERTLTTARLRLVRPALAWALSGLAWKLPELGHLEALGVELRDGVLRARFASASPRQRAPSEGASPPITIDAASAMEAMGELGMRGAFERFVEDLELKRHHGQIDRLLAKGQVREAVAEVYRALDGPPRPGFLAQRLIGICASRPILYDEGDKVCRELLASHPMYPDALAGLASLAIGRGRIEEAAVHLERLSGALSGAWASGDSTAADLVLAEILREIDPTEARAALERVIARAPDHEEALEGLIALAEHAGDHAHAMSLYKRLLFAARSTERTRDAGLRLARHALDKKQPEEARVFLKLVLEAAPNDLDAQLALADVEAQEGHDADALKVLEAALRTVPPTDGQAMARLVSRLARLLLERSGDQRDRSRARRVLWRAVDAIGLGDAQALELARLAIDAGEPELADRYGERIERESPLWPRAACARARAWLLRGEAQRALQTVLDVIERYPSDDEALELLTTCTPDLDSRERLLHTLKQAAERVTNPTQRARVRVTLGRLYESLDLDWDAIAPYEAVLADDPDGPWAEEVAERLLALYGRHGMWPAHQELCASLMNRAEEPAERVPLLVRFGRVALRELGQPDRAREPLGTAVELAPRRTEALELLRDTLEALGEGAALIPVLRRLESVHGDERVKTDARVRLAELQLEVLGAPGQARATLSRLGGSAEHDPRVGELKQRLGLAPRAAEVERTPAAEAQPGREAPATYEEALRAADEVGALAALAILDRVLDRDPLHIPSLELARLLAMGESRMDRAFELSDTLLELTVSRAARIALLEEVLALCGPADEARRRRYAGLLERLRPAPESAEEALGFDAEELEAFADLLGDPAPALGSESESEPELEPAGPALPKTAEDRIDVGDRLAEMLGRLERAASPAEAEALATEILALDPDCVAALEVRAESHRRTERWRELADDLARLEDLAFDADLTMGYLLERASVLADFVGDAEGAVEAWARYLDWQPLDDVVFGRLRAHYEGADDHEALAALHARRAEGAEEALEEAFDPRPFRRAAARARLAEARVRLDRLEDAEASLEAAELGLALAGDDPELMEVKIRALALLNRREECRATIDRLLPLLLDGPLKDEMRLLRGH